MDARRFARAIEAIDAVNAQDPNRVDAGGVARPKELVHADMVTQWVRKLRPDASEELLLAARAHHIRRWASPRQSFPEGRAGYLSWRAELKKRHAEDAGQIMTEAGYPGRSVRRVQEIIRRIDLKGDAEAQTLEDALCLVFLETQLGDVAERLEEAKMIDVIRKTLRKMSEAAKACAVQLALPAESRKLLEKSLGAHREGV